MKIVVVGAGIGGLYAAGLLAEQGHEVTVYEKEKKAEDMRYDWFDDVNPQAFSLANLPLPEGSYPKKDWTFYPPNGNGKMRLHQKKEWIDFSVNRKKLNEILINNAKNVTCVFGVFVKKVLIRDDKVVGVLIKKEQDEEVFCDLVIDSCGVFSPLRESLPASWGFPEVSKESVFFVERSFYALREKVTEDTNKVYMKHRGEKGISWCITDQGEADILIGRVGKLTAEEKENALQDLCERNPVLPETCLKKGKLCTIPVRRPLSRFVWDGYACIGDSACMTVPMIGSGIATSLLAASFLAETLRNGDASAKNLWTYQRKCVSAFREHYGVECLKNWLLERESEEVTWFFTSGILSNDDLCRSAIGKMIKLAFPDVLHKGLVGMKNPALLWKTLRMLLHANKAIRVSEKIPKVYDIAKIRAWQNKTDGMFI